MADFLQTLFRASLLGGVFILAAMLLRAGMKNRLPKHFLLALWGAALLRLLVPASVSSPTSVYNYVHFQMPAAAPGVAAGMPGREIAAAAPIRPGDAAARTALPSASPPPAPAAVRGAAAWALSPGALFGIWLGGAAALAAVFALGYWRLRRRFADAFLVKGNRIVDQWRQRRRAAPLVMLSDRTTVPLAFGLFRPRIVIPSGFALDDKALLEGVLEHEYIHGRHRHNAMKVLVYLALAVHWFNPIVWLYWRLFNHDVELACDEGVIRALGVDRRAEYAHSLVAAAERAGPRFPLLSAFSARDLKERIVDIMAYRPSSFRLLFLEAALVCLLFAVFGMGPLPLPIARAATVTGAAPPPAAAAANNGMSPVDVALSATRGGRVVQWEVEWRNGGEAHEFEILAHGYEHRAVVDPNTNTLLHYERGSLPGQYADADFDGMIGMDDAVAAALSGSGVSGGAAIGCELERLRQSSRYVYVVEIEAHGDDTDVIVDAVTGQVLGID